MELDFEHEQKKKELEKFYMQKKIEEQKIKEELEEKLSARLKHGLA